MNKLQEGKYVVIHKETVLRFGSSVILERRLPISDVQARLPSHKEPRDYLVLVEEGGQTYFKYTYGHMQVPDISADEALERMQHDWAKLLFTPDVDIQTLQWCELVHNGVGHTDKGLTIYY